MRGFFGIVAGAMLLSACYGQPAEPALAGAWIRLPAVSGHPGAAYFTLTGGAKPDKVTGISSPAAQRIELHETMKHGGMNSMHPLGDTVLSAGKTIVFAPGGRHGMLFGLDPAVKAGGTIPLTLTLESGKQLQTQAKVVGAGDPQP